MRKEKILYCNKCGDRRATFRRRYSGEQLCNTCFVDSIERKVRKTITKYKMFKRDDKVGVALSGGKDSVTLLNILNRIEKWFPSARIVALTIDEGIKGYREEAVNISRAYCREMKIKQVVSSFKEIYGQGLDEIVEATQGKSKLSTCAICGILRRRALNVLARENGVDKLATAHNLDDETQTIILNMMRGDTERLKRMKPKQDKIHPKFVQRAKPLFDIPEREIALYAYIRGLKFQEEVCPYRGTSMRQEVREILGILETKHPGIKYNLIRSFERLTSKSKEELNIEIQECKRCGEPSSQIVCRTCIEFSKLENSLKQREPYIGS